MSRNFELLQKLEDEQKHRARVEYLQPAEPEHHAEVEATLPPHSPAELCALVRRVFLMDLHPPRVVVFSSVERGSGCSWIAAHCAEILATQVRQPVCLMDANLGSPSIHDFFRVPNDQGFAEALTNSGSLMKYAVQVSPTNLWVLTAGSRDQIPWNIETIRESMRALRQQVDYVIVDASPWNFQNHTAALGSVADGMILVLKADHSRRNIAQQFVRELEAANIRVLGAVLNQRTFPIPQALYNKL